MATEIKKRTTGDGVVRVYGTGTLSAGSLTVVSGLTAVFHARAAFNEDPGAVPSWYYTISGGSVTFTSGNIDDKDFSFEIVGV